MNPQSFEFLFPFKGYDVGAGLQTQPPFTSARMLNVWPYDRNGRPGGAVRPGLTQFAVFDPAGSDNKIRAITQATISDAITGERRNLIVVVDGIGDVSTKLSTDVGFTGASRAGGVAAIGFRAATCSDATSIYFADGTTNVRYLQYRNPGALPAGSPGPVLPTPSSGTVYNLVTTSFTGGGGTVPVNPRICVFWRARLLLAGQTDNPHVVWASKVGNVGNWDYAASVDDPTRAWAVNVAAAGQQGDNVSALIPFTDDTLLICGERSIYRLDGDPAAGGTLSLVSSSVGVSGKDAWCLDGGGTAYFVGLQGLFSCSLGGGVRNLSGTRMGDYWAEIITSNRWVQCVYDYVRNGVWIFASSSSASSSVHLYYDINLDAFFPMQFPNSAGPTMAAWQHDPSSVTRGVVLGGHDGVLRRLGSSGGGLNDDGTTAITSSVMIGPIQPAGDGRRVKTTGLTVILGDARVLSQTQQGTPVANSTCRLSYSLYGASSATPIIAADAGASSVQSVTVQTWGRQRPQNHRMNANTYGLLLTNSTADKTWSFDRAIVEYQPAGRNR